MTSPSFTLPQEIVDAARKEREEASMSSWAKPIDDMVRTGMRGLETVAGGFAQQLSPFAQALQEGGLKVPTLEDLSQPTNDAASRMRGEWERAQAAVTTALTQPQAYTAPGSQPSGGEAIGSGTAMPSSAHPAPAPMPQISAGAAPSRIASAGTRASRFAPEIAQVSAEEGVPEDVLAALVDTEDSGETSVSPAGARGIGQVVPGQGYDLPGEDASIPLVSLRQMARAAKDKYRITGGDWDEVGAAYFGYGTDAGGMTTDVYRERYRQNRARYASDPSGVPQATRTATPSAADQPEGQTWAAGSYTPNQIDSATAEGLDYETALAVCGPAAAIAFARKNGRNPTMQEALGLAKQVGWTAAQGMAGPSSQRQLLASMGVASRLVDGAPDWKSVAADVQRGNPVILSTPGHYFVAERFDPESGQFDFGNSAAVLKASKGRRWFKPEELSSLGMGEARASLFMDSPESPSPSVVAGRTSPNVGAPPPAAPAAPLTASPAGPAPQAGGGSPDMVTIENVDTGKQMPVRRDHVPSWLKPVAPGMPPSWRVVGPVAQASPLDAARASTGGGETMARMSLPQRPGEVKPEAPVYGTPGLGESERAPGRVGESIKPGAPIGPGDLAYPYDQVDPRYRIPPYGVTDREGADPFIDRIEGAYRDEPAPPPRPVRPNEDIPTTDRREIEGQMYRQPLNAQQPELPADAPYDPRDADSGAREGGQEPWMTSQPSAVTPDAISTSSGFDAGAVTSTPPPIPFTTSTIPALDIPPTSPPTSVSQASVEEQAGYQSQQPAPPEPGVVQSVWEGVKRAGTGLYEAAKEPQNAIDTMGAAAGAAGQAVLDEANPTPEQQAANTGKLPMQRGLEVVQAALDAGGTEVGRRVGRAAGLSDEELFSVFGIPVSGEDIAGFAGSVGLDPTNYVGAAPAARTLRAGAEAAAPVVGRAARGLAEEGARQLMDLAPSPAVIERGGGGQPIRPTVETLQEQLETATQAFTRARQAGDDRMAQFARERASEIESQLADAQNARRGLEPAIESDVGRRVESLPLAEETADTLTGAGSRAGAASPSDLSGPVSVPPQSISLNAGFGAVPESPRAPRRTGATRNTVRQFEDRYESSGARSVVDAYEAATPARIQEAQRRAVQIATDLIAGEKAPPAVRQRTSALIQGAIDEGERMLDGSKVVATGIDGRALDALIDGEGFTNKFAGLSGIEEAIDATWERVGKARITRDQAREFVLRELRADQMVLGEHNLNGRMYAHVTAGPPQIAEAKAAAWFVWDNDTPRVSSVHHHYGLGSPHADIHAETPEGIKRAMWGTDAVAGTRRIEAVGGPLNVGWRGEGITAGNRLLADTPWAVGPSGESRMRVLTQLLATPMSERNSIGQMIRRGEIKDPQTLAAALLRESSGQQQPAVSSAKAALGIPLGEAGGEAGEAVAERFRLGMATNRTRNEALIVDPNPARVRAIYLVGNGQEYLNEVLERTGGVVKGRATRLEAAQAAQAALSEKYGRDVPIIFKDTSVRLDEAGQPSMVSGSKMINDAVEILPDGSMRPISAEQALAPGRGEIRDRYMGAGFPDIGATIGTLPPSAAATDRLGVANQVLGQGVASTFSGGVSAAAADQLGDPTDPNRKAKAFVAGALVPALGTRGIRAGLKAAGVRGADAGGGALATLGSLPPSIQQIPGVGRAIQAAQRREAAMAARGLTSPSVWEWIKQAGYAGIYGPTTFVSSVVGGAQELIMGQPKEAIRALVAGRPGSYRAQAAAQLRAMPDGLTGLGRVLWGSDSAATAAVSGGSQGTADLSERIVNPVGHFAARVLERPGEILTEAPDAVFRPMFLAQGMRREADAIAAEMGMRGPKAASYAETLMQSAEILRANPGTRSTSAEAQRVVKAGADYADELGYKGDPGGFGRWLGQTARRDDAIGVLASFLVPFPSMAARVTRAAARSTPGVGLLPAVRRGQPTRFDVIYDQAFGTAVAGGIAYWAFNGGITGSGPADAEKRKMMIAEGWQPNSTLVAGRYIPNRVFQRFQPMLDTAGELHDALAYGKKDRKPSEMVADLVKRGSRVATDQVGLSGLADLHDMFNQGFSSQFPGWAARSAARYLPYAGILRAAATSQDTKQRKAEGWGDEAIPTTAIGQNLEMIVPGRRQNLPAVQDVLGREAPNPQEGLGAIAPRSSVQRDDPVIDRFQQAGVDIGAPKTDITDLGVPVALTPAETRRWNTLRGAEIIKETEKINPQIWETMKPERRVERLDGVKESAANLADLRLKSEIGTAEWSRRRREARQKAAS